MSRFHDLTVTGIDRQTPESVAVSLDVPPELQDDFQYQPGQYLTLAATIGGEDIRRSYSICSAPGDEVLKVGVKKVEDGAFSSFVNDGLAIGDTIRVMPPEGRFTPELGSDHHYLLIAAGSGITPMLSIAKTVLNNEQGSQITLVYGNKSTETIMFREELDDLKDRHMGRFSLVHVLSRETQDIDLAAGPNRRRPNYQPRSEGADRSERRRPDFHLRSRRDDRLCFSCCDGNGRSGKANPL